MKFSVIGGDARFAHLRTMLVADGHDLCEYALEYAGRIAGSHTAANVREAVCGADCVILPLPVSDGRGNVNAPFSGHMVSLSEVFAAVDPVNTLICGGKFNEEERSSADGLNLRVADYYEREDFTIWNAVATVEATIELLLRERESMLRQASVLVIGYGRIGKLLAASLKALGAHTAVSARKPGDLAWIAAQGFQVCDTGALKDQMRGFEIIVNTVPAPVLNEALLNGLDSDVLLVDLASKPGGIDFAAAERLGLKTIWALGLPAASVPKSAGAFVRDAVYKIVKELNEEDGKNS